MTKAILKLLAESFLGAARAYAKSTPEELDDKAVELIASLLKYFKVI